MSLIYAEDILTGFVKSVRAQVGNLLSDLPSQDPQNPIKAVIKDVQGGVRPDYPYIVLSLEDDDKESDGWLRYVTTGQDNETHIISEQSIGIRVTCYGSDATKILKTLRALCLDDWTRIEINQDTGANFIDYTDIVRQPVYLETDFIDTSYMTARFTAVSDLVTSAGLIETVTGEGRYLRYEGDDNPYVENINVSS